MKTDKHTCYICHSGNTETDTFDLPEQNRKLNLLICNECGHASRINQPDFTENLKEQGDTFDKMTKKLRTDLPWYNRYRLLATRIDLITGKKGGKILDIGCGSGQRLVVLNKKWDKYGVDLSQEAAKLARKFSGANIFCGSIESYKPECETFDVITAFALIEHLKSPHDIVQWSYKHLKHGGLFLLMTGDRESEVARNLGHQWPLYIPMVHLHFFSNRSLSRLLNENGFDIIRREWRYTEYGTKSFCKSCIIKTKEILGFLGKPYYDHLYLYARKP